MAGTPHVAKVLALDWGRVRIGVALSDGLGLMAHPRPPIVGKDEHAACRAIAKLVAEEQVEVVLLGYPIGHTGGATGSAAKVQRFATLLAQSTGIDVQLIDERLSTAHAHRLLKEASVKASHRSQKVDGAAAAVMLQAWLDARG